MSEKGRKRMQQAMAQMSALAPGVVVALGPSLDGRWPCNACGAELMPAAAARRLAVGRAAQAVLAVLTARCHHLSGVPVQ